jgi:hypothetical protein
MTVSFGTNASYQYMRMKGDFGRKCLGTTVLTVLGNRFNCFLLYLAWVFFLGIIALHVEVSVFCLFYTPFQLLTCTVSVLSTKVKRSCQLLCIALFLKKKESLSLQAFILDDTCREATGLWWALLTLNSNTTLETEDYILGPMLAH